MRVTPSSFIRRASLWLPKAAGELWNETDGGWYGPRGACSCCESCSIFTDDFNRADDTNLGSDWSEVSGSWAITSNTLRTSSTSAVCVHDTGYGSAQMKVAVSLQGASGDFLRVIFGYVDSSNYWFAEVKIGAGTAGRFDLYRRSGGSNTLRTSNVSLDIPADTWHNCSVCLTSEAGISAVLDIAGGQTVTAGYSTALTTEDAVGVGTGSTASASTQFDDLAVTKAGGDCPECALPNVGCGNCDDGLGYYIYKATLYASFGTGFNAGQCGATECNKLLGDYYMPFKETVPGSPSSCVWESAFSPTVCPTRCGGYSIARFEVLSGAGLGAVRFTVIDTDGQPFLRWNWTFGGATKPCLDWTPASPLVATEIGTQLSCGFLAECSGNVSNNVGCRIAGIDDVILLP